MDKSPERCPEKPERLAGQPIGMYHCPTCGVMQLAGVPAIECPYDEEHNDDEE